MGTPITQITAVWSNFIGGPGYSNFYFLTGDQPSTGAQADADAVHDFFDALVGQLPAGVRVQVSGDFSVLDDATGALLQLGVVATPPAAVVGQGSGGYAAPVGAVVNWLTAGLNRGRRVRGKTFVVPLVNSVFDTDGTLQALYRGVVQGAANALISARTGSFAIWSRPRLGVGGAAFAVSGATVPDIAAILSSRRD